MGALQIDPFPRRIGGEQHPHPRVVPERLLGGAALRAVESAVDQHQRLGLPEPGGDPPLQIVQGVAVLGEDDELVARRGSRRRYPAVGRSLFARLGGDRGAGEQPAEQVRELPPFCVLPALPQGGGEPRESSQRADLGFEFGHRARRGGGVERPLRLLRLLVGQVRQVFDLLLVEFGPAAVEPRSRGAWRRPQLLEPGFEPLAATPERLVDRRRRGGQPALQYRQGEAHGASPLAVRQRLGAVALIRERNRSLFV